MKSNWLPDYLESIPRLKFVDYLGALLTGTLDPGPVEYTFEDVIKQSGHACPTIAGAYGIVLEGMSVLYSAEEIPVRGGIKVVCPETPSTGAMGPLSQAISYLTGASGENGFHGLGGQHQRKGLLTFSGQPRKESPFVFTRLDTGKSVGVFYHAEKIPSNPQMGELMQKTLSGSATSVEAIEFGQMWQERVKFVLADESNRKKLFQIVSL